MNQTIDVVEWLQERAFRMYGPTMEAAHTKTKEWLWADEITRLRASNKILRLELIKQWWSNHSEHCGGGTYQKFPWPHEGDCYWPLPECLSDITPEEIAAAIRGGSGK